MSNKNCDLTDMVWDHGLEGICCIVSNWGTVSRTMSRDMQVAYLHAPTKLVL